MSGRADEKKLAKPWGQLPLATVVLLCMAAAGVCWLVRKPGRVSEQPTRENADSTDPRRAYKGPYRNIDPAVGYVGDAACAACHEGICKTYAQHPMGRSFRPAAEVAGKQRYTPETNNPFVALGRQFDVDRRGDQLWQRQKIADADKPVVELAQEVHWVIGSGKKGYSYLTERGGYVLQTPISWYTQKGRWDLSPGFVPATLAGRTVPNSCLFCHANRLRENPEQPDRLLPPSFAGHSIGCERCHGPGELHAAGDLDHTIVNPGRLEPALRDAVCEQCHLEGEARVVRSGRGLFDYRPGLPLHEFWSVLVQTQASGEDAKAVNHVEQMVQSTCFRQGTAAAKMGCISCHDPHVDVSPQRRVAHYRGKCLNCHAESKGQRGCSESLTLREKTSPEDNCIVCHMPRYTSSDVAHTASTDHRILRRPQQRPAHAIDLDHATFADFYRHRYPDGDPQAGRNLGIGLVKLMHSGMLQPQRYGQQAVMLLESALGRFPHDAVIWEHKTMALTLLRRPDEALPAAQATLARWPGNWRMLAQAARAAQELGQTKQAVEFWRQAIDVNPLVVDYQVNLLGLLLRTEQFAEARRRCQKLLQLDPFNLSGRQAWIGFLLREGKKDEARAEFAIIRRLKPADLAGREEWFAAQLR